MELSNFIHQLLTAGAVAVKPGPVVFTIADEQEAAMLLKQYYHEDIQEIPGTAPAFDEAAALWAAKYVYTTVYLLVMRDQGEDMIKEKLLPYTGTVDAAATYSADLVMRYLPSLLELARGLSPADVLVKVLEQTAAEWPFSSTGIDTGPVKQEQLILAHDSLRITYADRLIAAGNLKKLSNSEVKEQVLSAAGLHLNIFWPEAATTFKNDMHG